MRDQNRILVIIDLFIHSMIYLFIFFVLNDLINMLTQTKLRCEV